jgi:hypothetical protein
VSASVALDTRREQAVTLLAALSWLAGLIHFAVAPAHFEEWAPFAVCFAVAGLLQVGWAAAFFRAPSFAALGWNALLAGGLIFVWLLSRTVGLPVGPDAGTPEAVGLADVGATAAEAVLVAAALFWRHGEAPRWLLPLGAAALALGGLGLVMGCGHAG